MNAFLTYLLTIGRLSPIYLISAIFVFFNNARRNAWRRIAYYASIPFVFLLESLFVVLYIHTGNGNLINGIPFALISLCLHFGLSLLFSSEGIRISILRFLGGFALQSAHYRLVDIFLKITGLDSSFYAASISFFLGAISLYIPMIFVVKRFFTSHQADIKVSNLLLISVLVLPPSVLYNGDFYTIFYGFCLDILAIYFVFTFIHSSQLEVSLDTMQRIMKQEIKRREISQANIEVINRKVHDLKHMVNVWESIPDEEKERYFKEIKKSVDIYNLTRSSNNASLDAVLLESLSYCEKKGIVLDYACDGSLLSFMDASDIAVLFGNILDNAMEYVSKLQEEKKIVFHIYSKGGFVCAFCKNHLREQLDISQGLKTTKDDVDYHGYGLKSIECLVKKYGGSLKISTDNGEFVISLLIPCP